MPVLKDHKREMFAQHLAAGRLNIEAYRMAGYSERGKHPHQLASRLAYASAIRRRVAELRELYATQHGYTVGVALAELETARQHAIEAGNASAEVAACMGKAKLFGYLVEKVEDVTIRKPSLIPTKAVELSEAEWTRMVAGPPEGARSSNGSGNGSSRH